MQTRKVYITRDTDRDYIEVWPDHIGIRKFHGCVQYGAAWNEKRAARILYQRRNSRLAPRMNEENCIKIFGFFSKEDEAWHIDGRGKKTKVDIGFSDDS